MEKNGDELLCVEMIYSRDESGLDRLLGLCQTLCRHIAFGILGDASDTDEVINDMLLCVWRSIPPNRPDSIKQYAARITRNLAVNRYHRSHAAKRDGGCVVELEELIENPGLFENGHGDPVAETMEAAELSAAIADFLRGLKPEDRVMFIRRYWYMDDEKSIAKRLGIGCGTLRSRLHRLRKKLKAYLIDGGHII